MAEDVLTRAVVRDGVTVEGADAETWLQGQVTQDVSAMADGEIRHALVLSPQGKVVALGRVSRLSEERYLLDVERGHGMALYERLMQFKLRVRASIDTVTVVCEERAGAGWDSLGPPRVAALGEVVPEEAGELEAVFEAARILAGVPRLGWDITERTIPQEAGNEFVARTVSFTKGCYTGQELVARLDARGGNVPRQLRVVRSVVASKMPALPGAAIYLDGRPAGELTSTAPLPGEPAWVALGYVKRAALADDEVDAEVEVAEGAMQRAVVAPIGAGRA